MLKVVKKKLDGGKTWERGYIVLTFTDWCLSRPLTTSETPPHVFSDQWEPSVAGVSGLGANCGPSDAHSAIIWVGKISTVHNCSKKNPSLIITCFQAPSQLLLHNNMSQSSRGAWERGYLCVHMIICKNTIIQVFETKWPLILCSLDHTRHWSQECRHASTRIAYICVQVFFQTTLHLTGTFSSHFPQDGVHGNICRFPG